MSPLATLAMAACKPEMASAKGCGGDCELMDEPCFPCPRRPPDFRAAGCLRPDHAGTIVPLPVQGAQGTALPALGLRPEPASKPTTRSRDSKRASARESRH